MHNGMLPLVMTLVLLSLRPLDNLWNNFPCETNNHQHILPNIPLLYTLSQYAQDLGQHMDHSKLKLQFLPGDHMLDVQLAILQISTNWKSFVMELY